MISVHYGGRRESVGGHYLFGVSANRIRTTWLAFREVFRNGMNCASRNWEAIFSGPAEMEPSGKGSVWHVLGCFKDRGPN